MAGTDDWSTNPSLNTSVGGVSIAEGCPPGNMNNADRAIMALAKAKFDAIDAALAGINVTIDPTLIALGNLATGADQLPYFTGSDTAAQTPLTTFARTLLDDGDAATMCATLGAVRLAALSLGDPGYVRLQVGGGFFQVAWGTASFASNGSTTVNYAAAFPNASYAVVNAPRTITDAGDNDPGVTTCSTTGFVAFSASNASTTGFYIAVGF